MSSSEKQLDLTPEELRKFEVLLKDKHARDLLMDYIREISDPKVRAENEAYLAQLERENALPAGKQLLKPEPAFCVELKPSNLMSAKARKAAEGAHRVYINICYSDKIEPAGRSQAPGGAVFRVPHALSSMRPHQEKDKLCHVYDIVFNTKTVRSASTDARIKKLLIETAIDAVETRADGRAREAPNAKRNYRYKELDSRCIAGPPPVMLMAADGMAAANSSSSSGSNDKQPGILTPPPPPEKREAEKEKKPPSSSSRQKSASSSTAAASSKPGLRRPFYTIVHRDSQAGLAELDGTAAAAAAGATQGRIVVEPAKRPAELVVTFHLPLLDSPASTELDVFRTHLRLHSPPHYHIDPLPLPFPVDETPGVGTAKWKKATKELIVTLKVLPATKEELAALQRAARQAEEDRQRRLRQQEENEEQERNRKEKEQEEKKRREEEEEEEEERRRRQKQQEEEERKRREEEQRRFKQRVAQLAAQQQQQQQPEQPQEQQENSSPPSSPSSSSPDQQEQPVKKKKTVRFDLPDDIDHPEKVLPPPPPPPAPPKPRPKRSTVHSSDKHRPQLSFSQTDGNVTIVLKVMGATHADTEISFHCASEQQQQQAECEVRIKTAATAPKRQEYNFSIRPYAAIVPAKCSFHINPKNIVIQLAKAEPGQWPSLEASPSSSPLSSPTLSSSHPAKPSASPLSSPVLGPSATANADAAASATVAAPPTLKLEEGAGAPQQQQPQQRTTEPTSSPSSSSPSAHTTSESSSQTAAALAEVKLPWTVSEDNSSSSSSDLEEQKKALIEEVEETATSQGSSKPQQQQEARVTAAAASEPAAQPLPLPPFRLSAPKQPYTEEQIRKLLMLPREAPLFRPTALELGPEF